MMLFKQKKQPFPDETARAFIKSMTDRKKADGGRRTQSYKKLLFMRMVMDGRTPPKAAMQAQVVLGRAAD